MPRPKKEQNRACFQKFPDILRRRITIVPRTGSYKNRTLSRTRFHAFDGFLHAGNRINQLEGLRPVRIGISSRPIRPMPNDGLKDNLLIDEWSHYAETTQPIRARTPSYIVNVKICQRGCARFPIF